MADTADNQPSGAERMFGDFAPALVEFTDDVLFGQVWTRAGLSANKCSLVTVAALTTLVTEGVGYVQSRGGPLITIRPGDVIRSSGGEEHWHGTTPDNFMTHIAITEGETDWGEHLTDADHPRAA